jgi:hypothetical protein
MAKGRRWVKRRVDRAGSPNASEERVRRTACPRAPRVDVP